MRWYRRLVFRVYAWSKAMRPEESPEALAVGIMAALLILNAIALVMLYYQLLGRDLPTRAPSVFGLIAFPCTFAYVRYFLRRLPQIHSEFENPDQPSIGGPGMAFVIYACVSIALTVVLLAMDTHP